jgi:hypothetical protein
LSMMWSRLTAARIDPGVTLDVVVGGRNGELSWLQNSSAGVWTGRAVANLTSAFPWAQVASADWDKDGDVDIVAANMGQNSFSLADNDGSGIPGFAVRVVGSCSSPVGVAVADIGRWPQLAPQHKQLP